MTKHDIASTALAAAFLLTLAVMPAQTTPTNCYRTKAGVMCQQGKTPAGGSGITPVKR